jgi:hypothetical protein
MGVQFHVLNLQDSLSRFLTRLQQVFNDGILASSVAPPFMKLPGRLRRENGSTNMITKKDGEEDQVVKEVSSSIGERFPSPSMEPKFSFIMPTKSPTKDHIMGKLNQSTPLHPFL